MRVALASLGASLLLACGSEPDVSATLRVVPPMDDGCLGVSGFVVKVAPTGAAQQTQTLIAPSPILDPSACALPDAFSIPDLDPDKPLSVNITGFDGTGTQLRVSGTAPLENLRTSEVRLRLISGTDLPPVLVFYRNPHLTGASLSDVKTMTISRQMGAETVLIVERKSAGDFFDREPGAYGIAKIAGLPDGTALTVKFDLADGRTLTPAKFTIAWSGKYYFETQ